VERGLDQGEEILFDGHLARLGGGTEGAFSLGLEFELEGHG
jgi:hypothetical protein